MSDRINEKQFTCIMCPLGCTVTVKSDDKGDITEILGNTCKKGEAYARDEFKDPKRVLTSTVAIEGAEFPHLPVRTSGLIPKGRIIDLMKEIRKIKVKAPVKKGDVILANILGLDVDVIATRDLGS
jgi:CxxC motif-containing protein